MFWHNISRHIFVDRALAPVGAGTGDTTNGDIIDTAGYESIVFAVHFGAIVAGAVVTIKVQGDTASGGGTMADISGASVTVPDTGDNLYFWSTEIHRPTKRYLRVTVTRATSNVTINSGFVLMARGAIEPPALGANVGGTALPAVLVSVP